MSYGHRTVALFLTVIGILLCVIAGLCLHWPPRWWLVAVGALAVLSASAVAATGRTLKRRAGPIPVEYQLEPDWPLHRPERREQRVKDVALPSSVADYDFLFSALVRWCPLDAPDEAPLVNAAGLAADAVLERARKVTELVPPHRSSLAQHRLSGALGVMEIDGSGRITAMAEEITLTLASPDCERLDRLSGVRKDEALWEHERKYEQSRRRYLEADVLKDTGSAVVWWLARNDDKIDKTVDDLDVLARLSAAANNTDIPEHLTRLVPSLAPPAPEEPSSQAGMPWGDAPPPEPPGPESHLDALLTSADLTDAQDPVRIMLLERMIEAFEGAGATDLARRLRRRFDPFGTPAPSGHDAATDESGAGDLERLKPDDDAAGSDGEGGAPPF